MQSCDERCSRCRHRYLPVDHCRSRSHDLKISAPMVPVAASASNEQLQWHGQVSTPIDQLRSVAKTNCEAAAALRFIRVPWLAMVEGELVLGDLRYDLEPELGFAEIVVNDDARTARRFVPDWREPRHRSLNCPASPTSQTGRVTCAWR